MRWYAQTVCIQRARKHTRRGSWSEGGDIHIVYMYINMSVFVNTHVCELNRCGCAIRANCPIHGQWGNIHRNFIIQRGHEHTRTGNWSSCHVSTHVNKQVYIHVCMGDYTCVLTRKAIQTTCKLSSSRTMRWWYAHHVLYIYTYICTYVCTHTCMRA